jgi:hypothetical protein
VIWTDNVFLNDVDEDNVHLNAVFDQSTGEVITDPDRLAQIEQTQPEFAGDSTQGRQSDFVIQTELGCDFDIPVNDQYFKVFGADRLQVLSFKIRNQEYLDLNDLDNNSIYLSTDWFGFLSDLFHGEWGNAYWVRVADDYSKVSDPLDASIRLLTRNGVTTLKTFETSSARRTPHASTAAGGGTSSSSSRVRELPPLARRPGAAAGAAHAARLPRRGRVRAGLPPPEAPVLCAARTRSTASTRPRSSTCSARRSARPRS